MLRRIGEKGFTRISWDEALTLAGERIRRTDPNRFALYMTSRGITNEAYYVAQKAIRFLGSNNVDNASRICHAPSTVALKRGVGATASTCSYSDWIGTDLLVLIGSDLANNQPVSTKYLYHAKRAGTKIVLINPYREPGWNATGFPPSPNPRFSGPSSPTTSSASTRAAIFRFSTRFSSA
jgi:anaerobic selenocysteine-containing dehydrogenase